MKRLPLILILLCSGCASPLMRAAKRGDLAKVERLIADGAPVNKVSNNWLQGRGNGTAMRSAIEKGHAGIVRALLNAGFNPNLDPHGVAFLSATPLHDAIQHGRNEIANILLDAGADPNQRFRKDLAPGYTTPMEYAIEHGNHAIQKMLLAKGADPASVTPPPPSGGGLFGTTAPRPAPGRATAPVRPAAPAVSARQDAARMPKSDIDVPGYKLDERRDDFAVVVGIDKYKDLPSAQYAERDAEAMRDHLIAMGYPKRHVILLKGANATGNSLRKYLEEWLPRNVKPTSDVFFYYSGHGAPDVGSGKAYLVPWDGDASFLKSTAYPVEKLYASLNQLDAKQVVVALDACFSGAGGRSVLAKGTRPLVTKVDEGLSSQGRITLFAAASGEEVTATLEDEGHGMFTYFFLKGLNGAAKDVNGQVTVNGLYQYLKPQVQDEARLQNREQTPKLHSESNVILRAR